jgi:MFS family permease
VFVLEYSGIDPKILAQIDISALLPPGQVNVNPVGLLAGLGGPPVYQVALLSSLPLLVNGIASYILVPLSIAIGRRPVLLLSGVMAWTGGFWAGFSNSLGSHLAARCFQGLGAGAVEALIPLIIQDMMFINQRNKAFASVVASQGFIIVALGIARYVFCCSCCAVGTLDDGICRPKPLTPTCTVPPSWPTSAGGTSTTLPRASAFSPGCS